MNKDDGGNAFPTQNLGEDYCGMTLRDYFAAQCYHSAFKDAPAGDEWISIAKTAYQMADAMLEARK